MTVRLTIVAVLFVSASLLPARASPIDGDTPGGAAQNQAEAMSADQQAGRAIARHTCAACHTVPDQPFEPLKKPPAPSFRAIANKPGASAASLLAFLQTTHKSSKTYKDMPELKITDDQARKVVSYIMSLRK